MGELTAGGGVVGQEGVVDGRVVSSAELGVELAVGFVVRAEGTFFGVGGWLGHC